MAAPDPPTAVFPLDLARLAEMCREAGAAASTVISSRDAAVLFYKDPQRAGPRDHNSFDELHIQNQQEVRILIAVFPQGR